MSEEEWVKKLKKIKLETKKQIEDIRSGEEEFREKYKDQKKKIIEMIYSQVKLLEEAFKSEKPKIERHDWGVSLSLPIVHEHTHYTSGIHFYLKLTDKGYGVDVKRNGTSFFIHPPVELEAIKGLIIDYLEDRKRFIIGKEKELQRFRREWG